MVDEHTDKRASDRRGSLECHRPQHHYPASHGRRGIELKSRVDRRAECHAGPARQRNGPELQRQTGGQRGEDHGDAEGRGGQDCEPHAGAAQRRGDQAADDRTHGHRRGQEAVRFGSAVERMRGQDGEGHGELVGEGADQRHHGQRNKQAGYPRHVGQALPQLPAAPRRRRARREPGRIHRDEGEDHGSETPGVDQKAGPWPGRGDEDPGGRRPRRARHVQQHGVERDRVPEIVSPDHLHHECLPGGVFEGIIHPEDDGKEGNLPQPYCAVDGKDAEREGLKSHQGLEYHHQPALIDPVGDHPAVRGEE